MIRQRIRHIYALSASATQTVDQNHRSTAHTSIHDESVAGGMARLCCVVKVHWSYSIKQ
jgi:hypothetical protein